MTVLGILGGSGVYDIAGLEKAEWRRVASPFGETSDEFLFGVLDGLDVVFVPRHGRGHRHSPTSINYRANIDVLKRAGVTDLIAVSACGSFRDDMPPGTFVLVDQFVDRTVRRASSFFGKGCVAHVAFGHPTSPGLMDRLAAAAEAEAIPVVRGGTYVCMEGPQFSTLAESRAYKAQGVDVIGMTNLPEAKLAREAEIALATLAMITDYDCWKTDEKHVTAEAVMAHVSANAAMAKAVIARVIPRIPLEPCWPEHRALDGALMTSRQLWPEETVASLKPILERFL